MTVLDATDADIRAAAFQHIRRLQEVHDHLDSEHWKAAQADLAGDQADAAQLDLVCQASLGLAAGHRCEQLVGLGRALEGEMGQAEVLEVHQHGP